MTYSAEDAAGISLLTIILVFVASVVYGQVCKPGFDVRDLFTIEGRIDLPKFTVFASFVFSTWALIYLIIHDQFSEGYFVIYIGTYCGNQIAQVWLAGRGK